MARPTASAKSKRLVWRISDRAPQGEWVDPDQQLGADKKDLPEVTSGGWLRSSFDLLNGIDIDDRPDTVPADLFDELFPAAAPRNPKAPGH